MRPRIAYCCLCYDKKKYYFTQLQIVVSFSKHFEFYSNNTGKSVVRTSNKTYIFWFNLYSLKVFRRIIIHDVIYIYINIQVLAVIVVIYSVVSIDR